ncbi:MAG: peptidase MA family metallohydrolase [Chloroflexia bacterium]
MIRKGALLLLLAALVLPARVAAQEQPIRIVSEQLENRFPIELLFHIEAESQAADITRIKLFYRLRGSESETQVPMEFASGRRVQASYRWYTEYLTIPPGAPVLYRWEIRDAAGNVLNSEERTFYYDDVRFEWRTRSDESLTVFWYAGGDAFGEALYEKARTSLSALEDGLQARLDFPIRVVVYGSDEDFRSAFPRMNDWVGGRAFPAMGLTVQTIAPGDQEYLSRVIPHEIAHLLFFQLTDNPYVSPPSWLDEGLAVYSESPSNPVYDLLVTTAAADGTLLPMEFIVGGFPADYERALLAYAQSYSLVKFLIERYGEERLGAYLQAFKRAGIRFDEQRAFQEAFGVPFEEFLEAWRADVGLRGTPVIPTAVPTRTPATPPVSPTTPPTEEQRRVALPCLGLGLVLASAAFWWWRRGGTGGAAV